MSERAGLDVAGGTLAMGLLVGAAVVAYLIFVGISTPPHFKARLAQIDRKLAAADAALRKGAGSSAYSKGVVCADSAERATAALQSRVQAAASAAGVTISNLAATPGSSGQVGLTPIGLQFEASGHNDAVIAMLASLSRQTPTIFTDSADLTSQVSAVDLKFQGRIYCSDHL